MPVTFEVVVPTLRTSVRGRWLPTRDSAVAVLLVDNLGQSSRIAQTLFAQLELYLQSAGIASLRIAGRGDDSAGQAIDLLGGISFLRGQACQHILVVAAGAQGTLSSWDATRDETLLGMLTSLRARESSVPALITALGDLVATVRDAAESVRAVAILLPPEVLVGTSSRARARHLRDARDIPPPHQHVRAVSDAVDSAPGTAPSSPHMLFLTLPTTASGGEVLYAPINDIRPMVALLSRLYLWCRAWAQDVDATAGNSRVAPPADESDSERVPDTDSQQISDVRRAAHHDADKVAHPERQSLTRVHGLLRWLDEEWVRLLAEVSSANPASIGESPANKQSVSEDRPTGWSLRASRERWNALDSPTRCAWLAICKQAFTSMSELAQQA